MERDARHEAGLKLFAASQFEQASRELRSSLEAEPNSEKWNDWAAAEAACGRIDEALSALSRALLLDPNNRQAQENLEFLQGGQNRLPSFKIIQESSCGTGCADRGGQSGTSRRTDAGLPTGQGASGIVDAYFRELRGIPAYDPALSPEMHEALQRANSDSSYFVKEAYRRLRTLPEAAAGAILNRLETGADRDYRFLAIAAMNAMENQDWDRALELLRAAEERHWVDVFLERERIRCEELRQDAEPGKPGALAGINEYLAGSFCTAPWETMEITSWGPKIEQTGDVYFCCPAYMPVVTGNARELRAEEIWNSTVAQEVRKSIHDGSFRYCSRLHCPLISGRQLPSREAALAEAQAEKGAKEGADSLETIYPLKAKKGPARVALSYDRSCNLACPSCRSDYYTATKEEQEKLHGFYGEFVKSMVKDARLIYMDGAGETLASRHSREVLRSLNRQDFPALKFRIQSNGQLFDRRAYEEFDLRGRLERVDISIDAARPETYAVIRKGGTLKRLLENVEFLDGLRQREGESFQISFRFVISALNYREMPEVIRLAKRHHLDIVEFMVMRQWGQFSPEEARQLFVFNPGHPQHEDFRNVLCAPEMEDPIVILGSAGEFRKAVARQKMESSRPMIEIPSSVHPRSDQ
ncbi:MAG TPA: radical SAM protein [Candidatus Eisenbacteria bacterium]|nr:radical SAM protein [Candidatus Eisenbacteria bacterium]